MRRLPSLFREPLTDVLKGLERCLDVDRPWLGFTLVFLGLATGWWLYVPIHELLHVVGCLLAGGAVEELEVARIYGGDLLALIFDFVTVGGDYAGRLSGFDDRGSDVIYAITVLMPYLLTLFPGVWLMLDSALRRRAFLFGLALPMSLAPFISLIGDAYELGSILVTQVPPWQAEAVSAALRGDDLIKRVEAWLAAPPSPWLGGALAAMVGALWAFLTYGAGRWLARKLERRP